jgi:hypothetical protein
VSKIAVFLLTFFIVSLTANFVNTGGWAGKIKAKDPQGLLLPFFGALPATAGLAKASPPMNAYGGSH